MARQGRKRLSMDVPNNLHDELKKAAKIRNITITRYVLRILLVEILREQKIMSSTPVSSI
jgi:uncharacterized protein (DUF1778 family)